MNTGPWISAIAASLLGGAVGSLLTLKMAVDAPEARAERSSNAAGRDERDHGETDDEAIESDAERIRDLEHKVSLLTAALSKNGKTSEAARRAMDGGNAGTEFSDVADPVFEAAVLDIVDREQERKEEERTTFRAELRAKRSKQFAAHLAEKLQLRSEQQEEIARAITEHFDARQQMRDDDNPNRPVTRKEWRERMQTLSNETDQQLAKILDPEQLRAYEALEDDEKLTHGWGRRPDSDGRRESTDAQRR